jgi:predicted DNA-binding protein (MmcQ/YjbR family)
VAYDEGLAERIREFVPSATEKKMFGGIGWMERGNLVVGLMAQGSLSDVDALLVRCRPEETEDLLQEPGVRPFEQRGKAMKGWVLVEAEEVAEDPQLKAWVERSRKYVKTLPPK